MKTGWLCLGLAVLGWALSVLLAKSAQKAGVGWAPLQVCLALGFVAMATAGVLLVSRG